MVKPRAAISSDEIAVTATGTSCRASDLLVAVTTISSSRIGPPLYSPTSCAWAAGSAMIAAVHSETGTVHRRVVLVMVFSTSVCGSQRSLYAAAPLDYLYGSVYPKF